MLTTAIISFWIGFFGRIILGKCYRLYKNRDPHKATPHIACLDKNCANYTSFTHQMPNLTRRAELEHYRTASLEQHKAHCKQGKRTATCYWC